ncbi:hypothetical protein HID58_018920, partial [Brassica napus]
MSVLLSPAVFLLIFLLTVQRPSLFPVLPILLQLLLLDLLVHLARRCLQVQQQLQLSKNRPQQLRHHSPMQLSLLHQPWTLRVLRLGRRKHQSTFSHSFIRLRPLIFASLLWHQPRSSQILL